jgi:hypothetical protein
MYILCRLPKTLSVFMYIKFLYLENLISFFISVSNKLSTSSSVGFSEPGRRDLMETAYFVFSIPSSLILWALSCESLVLVHIYCSRRRLRYWLSKTPIHKYNRSYFQLISTFKWKINFLQWSLTETQTTLKARHSDQKSLANTKQTQCHRRKFCLIMSHQCCLLFLGGDAFFEPYRSFA